MLFRIHERVCGCDFSDQDACTFNPNDIVCAGCQERICCAIPAARARRGALGRAVRGRSLAAATRRVPVRASSHLELGRDTARARGRGVAAVDLALGTRQGMAGGREFSLESKDGDSIILRRWLRGAGGGILLFGVAVGLRVEALVVVVVVVLVDGRGYPCIRSRADRTYGPVAGRRGAPCRGCAPEAVLHLCVETARRGGGEGVGAIIKNADGRARARDR